MIFRDAVIWLSTLDLIGPESFVSFITNNTSDFFEPNGSIPHPDILAEAKDRLEKHHSMFLHRSVDEFILKFDSDRIASAQVLKRSLISNSLSNFDLWDWLNRKMVSMIDGLGGKLFRCKIRYKSRSNLSSST